MVSERLWSSSMSEAQETDALACSAPSVMHTAERNVEMPPSLESDLALMEQRVSLPCNTTRVPVSRFWVAPANVMPVYSQLERSPTRNYVGYR